MKKLLLLLLIYTSCLCLVHGQGCSENTNVNGIAGTAASNGNIGQSFTACKTGRLTSVSIQAGNAGTGFNEVIVDFYAGEGFGGTYLGRAAKVHVKANRTTTWNVSSLNIKVVEGQKYSAKFLLVRGSPQMLYGTHANPAVDYYPRGRILGIGQSYHDMFFAAAFEYVTDVPSPAHQAVGVSRIGDIQIQFSRSMVALGGEVYIRDIAADVRDTVQVADLIIDGGLVTIPSNNILNPNTQYEILISSSVLETTTGLGFGGYASGDWTFTTTNNSVPQISTTEGVITNLSPIPFAINFTEAVTGFDISDLVITNGIASNFTGSSTDYAVDVIASAEGFVKIEIPENITIEGNEAASDSIEYDITSPTATITSLASGITTNARLELAIEFSEAVSGFDINDFILTNATSLGMVNQADTLYLLALNITAEGTVTVDVPSAVALDVAGNGNLASNSFSIDYQVDIENGLISYYPLNAITWDLNQTNSDLSSFGGSLIDTTDHFGQAYGAYDFTNAILQESSFDNTLLESGFSISTWIRPNSEMGVISAKRIMLELQTASLYYEVGQMKLALNGTIYTHDVVLTADTWYYLAVSIVEGGDVKLYIDNVEYVLGTAPAALNAGIQNLFVGGTNNGNAVTSVLNGAMDEIRIYRKAINALEVAELFNQAELILRNDTVESCDNETFNAPDGSVFTDAGNFSYLSESGSSALDTLVTFTLTHIPSPNVTVATNNIFVCEGNEITLSGQGADTYTWDNGAVDGAAFIPTTTTTYTVTGTAANGCMNTTQVAVEVVPRGFPDEVVTTTAPEFCPDGSPFSGSISIANSTVGVNYSLRNSADDTVLDGPIAGTGSAINFSAGTLNASTTFNVYAEKPSTTPNIALDFDGVNDYVEVAINPTFDYENGYTIEVWINAATVTNNFPVFVIGNGTVDDVEIYIQANTNKVLVVHDRGRASIASTHFAAPPTNEWVHFAATYDGNSTVKLYYNGIEQASIQNTITSNPIRTAGASMKLGKTPNPSFGSTGGHFNGQLDEIRIWNTVKSPAELLLSKNACFDGTESDLEYYFKFDENTGTTVTDLVNGNNGTLINMDAATDWVASGVDITCVDYFTCGFQMTTEITIGDQSAPTAIAQDITVAIDLNTGLTTITPDMIDNGSTDNCTSNANMTFSLDKSTFTCDDLGDNTVTLTVTDESGHVSTAIATVTITSIINDETVAVTNATLCPGEVGGATVSIASSVTGVDYSLRNSADNSIVDGPFAGTGNAIDFTTGTITETTTFNVYAGNQPDEAIVLGSSGSNSFVSIANSPSLRLDANWTLESWVKPTSALLNIIEAYDGSGGFVLRTNGSKYQAYAMFSSASAHTVLSNTSVQLGVWTHIAATFNETTNELKIYINGVLDATNSSATIDQRGPTTSIKIGARGDDALVQSEHVQSDVRIWNIERSAQEIADNMLAVLIGNESGLVAYLDFNNLAFQATNMSIPDKSSNNNNGVVLGSYTSGDIVAGNVTSSSCGFQMTQEVTVTTQDNIAPTAIAQNITLQLDATGNVTATAADLNNGSTDNCATAADLTYSLDIATFTCADLGVNDVILTVTDLGTNQSTAAATITIEETFVPVALAQDISIVLDNTGNASITASDINNGSSDNCTAEANLTMNLDITAFTCADLGANTVTLTVEDSNGNQSTASSTVTVTEAIAPVAIVQNITLALDATGNLTATAADLNNGSSDNCTVAASLAYSLDISTFDCTNLGANNVVLTVSDESGNTSTANAVITVVDDLNPTITSQNITVQLDATGNASITAADINNGSTDNCTSIANLAVSIDISTFTCTDLGVNTVTLTVADQNGNSNTSTATVTVEDTVLPSIAVQNLTIQLDANGSASITATDVNNGSSDNCTSIADLILSIDKSSFDCSEIGDNAVILSVTDASGNVSQGVSVITIEDNIAPVVITQDITVRLDVNDLATITIADIDNGSSDNCNAGTLTLDIASFNLSNLGANTVTLTYDDGNGNTNSATAIVTIQEYKQAQTISFDAVADKTYGDGDITLVASASSGLAVTFSVVSGTVTLSGNTASITGTGDVVIEAAQAGNVDFAEASEQITFTINKAALTATADAQAITYGDAIPELTYTYSAFAYEESATVLIAEPSISTNANTGEIISGIGTYDITLTGGEALNYTISLVNASLEITRAALTIAADDKTITFGDAIPELTIAYDGFVNGEGASFLTAAPSVTTSATSESNADTYSISISGASANNYEITQVNGLLVIEQALASITITDLEFEEDGTAKIPTVTTDPADLAFTITYNGNTDAPVSGGEYEVIVTIDEVNYQGTSTTTLVINAILAIGDEAGLKVNVYPNPVSDILIIDSENTINGSVTLFNIKGELVINSTLMPKQTQLNISTLNTGLYILIIQDEKSAIIKKQTVLVK